MLLLHQNNMKCVWRRLHPHTAEGFGVTFMRQYRFGPKTVASHFSTSSKPSSYKPIWSEIVHFKYTMSRLIPHQIRSYKAHLHYTIFETTTHAQLNTFSQGANVRRPLLVSVLPRRMFIKYTQQVHFIIIAGRPQDAVI